ncbi:MAG: YraN family protein [Chitinophagaceae bacterium]
MALHIELGAKGEQLAEEYFNGLGYTILHKNWRNGRYEIDLIAEKKGILHFIEVKTRRSHKFGYPEDDVDRTKLRYLIIAGDNFVQQNPKWKRIQFDILAITIVGETPQYLLIQDVYL